MKNKSTNILLIIGGMTLMALIYVGNTTVLTFAQFDEWDEISFTIEAQISEDRTNSFDESLVYYNVKNFMMNISNNTELCPANDCRYNFVHEDFQGFNKDGVSDRSMEGVLKVTSQGKTKIFNLNSDLNLLEEESDPDGSVTKEILEGTLQLSQGDEAFGDEYIVNGTINWNNEKNGDLTLDAY